MVRVAVVGVGGMGQTHLGNLSRMENVQVVSICDSRQDVATNLAEPLGAKAYDDFHELIQDGGMDAVFVSTPPFARDDIEFLAAERGIHLFVEKPLGLDIEMVCKKEEAIAKSGVINSSGYCLRYLDTIVRVKNYLADKRVYLATGHRNEGLYAPDWWKQMHLSGGQFVDQTTHQVDLIRYLAGEINSVYAMYAQRAITASDPTFTIPDVGTVSMKLQSGAIANVSNTCLANYETRAELELIGDGFQVFLSKNGTTARIMDSEQDITINSRMNFVFEQDSRFIAAVESLKQDDILCSYSDAAKTLAVTLAANESADKGRLVNLMHV